MKSWFIPLLGSFLIATAAQAQDTPPAFEQVIPPLAPDYSNPANWARLGEKTASGRPAVFYVHPTTDRSMAHWNQETGNADNNRWTDASVIARQAAIFDICCAVYAPRYRQASRRALFHMEGDGVKAFDLAYSDVERAFDAFIAKIGDRPFILAGHSQGAFHLARLIERKVDATPLADRLVIAYVVGLNLSQGEFGKTYKNIGICETAAQTGCVVAWNAVLPSVDRAQIARTSEKRYITRYGDDDGKTILCINPLSFDRRKPAANAIESKGAAPGNPGEGPLKPRIAGRVAARCDSGALIVEPAGSLALEPLPGGSMHYHDFGLFFEDIRNNAAVRIKEFSKRMQRPSLTPK